MNDSISRQAAIKLAIDLDYESRGILKESKCREIENRYNMIPPAQPERKKGKWIEYDNSHCECPFCHAEFSYFENETEKFNYCPMCGSELEGAKNE